LVSCKLSNNEKSTFKWDDTSFTIGARRTIGVWWDINNACTMGPSYGVVCDTVVRFMKQNPELKIGVYNYVSPEGSYQLNKRISQVRAQSVVKYIISQGIDSARIIPRGRGASQPLPGCDAASISNMKSKEEKDAACLKDTHTEVVILATDYKASK